MEELENYTTQMEIPVQWGNMDAYQHVNNIVYLRWIECARVKYFEEHLSKGEISQADVGPILLSQTCKYIFPMTYPDTALVGFRVADIGEDRLHCEARIYSKNHKRLAAFSSNIIMPYSLTQLSKVPIPNSWIETIKNIENL